MDVLMMNMTSDSNQDYEEINGGSPIQKRNIDKGSLNQKVNNRDCDQIDSQSTSAQNQSINQNQMNSKQNSNQNSFDQRKRSSSILQASESSAQSSRSLLQGITATGMQHGNNNNTSQTNISYMLDELFALDKEMLVEKLQIQNSVLKTEKNHFEMELKRKADVIENLERRIEEIQKKYKVDQERKEQLEIEQTMLQKKINDIVNIYENSNDKSDVNSLKKVSADLRSELNLKQMIIEKQKETIKQLKESNDILQKNEVEILESQKKTQLIVDKFEIVNKDLQRFLKQSTEMQIKLRNQLMISDNNRQILEEKCNLQTQRATILQNNQNQHNLSLNQDVYGSRASMMNNEILRLTKGSQEQSFAFGHLESVNQEISFKKQNFPHQQSYQQKEDLMSQRLQEKSLNDLQFDQNHHQEEDKKLKLQKNQIQNKMYGKSMDIHSQQQQLHCNSLAAAAAGYSKFQNSLQCNALSKEELSHTQQEQETIINLSLLSQSNKDKDIEQIQQQLDSARQQSNQNKFYAQLQNSCRKNSSNNLMSSLKEHILSLSENKDNLNEQLHEILKESKRGNDKNVKELMIKFENRLGQFFNELAKQAETLVFLQQRLDEQDSLIESYHKQEEDNLLQQKQKYKKQIRVLQKDIECLSTQKDELVKQFEQQISETYEQATKEIQRQFQNQIDDIQSLLDQSLIREQQLELQVKQYKENSNQKQQRMLQRFKNNSISSNLNQYAINSNSNMINENANSNQNSQLIENYHYNNGDCGEIGSKTYRENSQHQQTRDESEYKENRNSQNIMQNQSNQHISNHKSLMSHNTYSPTPSQSINYLSSEQHDNIQSQFSARNTTNCNSQSKSSARSSIPRNDQQSQINNNRSSQNLHERQQSRKGDDQSIYSSRNYNLSPSSQQNQNEQNSLEFSQASQQALNNFNNTLKSINDNKNIHQNIRQFEEYNHNYNTLDNRIKHQENDQNNFVLKSQQQDQLKQYREDPNYAAQIQKKLYDQFSSDNNQHQISNNQTKKNVPMIPLPQSQTLKNKSSKSHQALNTSLQSNHSLANQTQLQDTFGQKDLGFHQQNISYEGQNSLKQNSFQEKQKSNGLLRAQSYSNLNSSRYNSQAASSCVGEYAESIHIMKESKQLNNLQNYESQNSNSNGYKNFIQQIQQHQNQSYLAQNQEVHSEEYQKSSADLNAFNNFTFTQSQQNYNGFQDIEAFYVQQQQIPQPNIPIQKQEAKQAQLKQKSKPSNKLQIITDTYDEHKLDQITSVNLRNDIQGLTEVNKSNSSQRIRSSSSNFANHQSTQNTSSHLLTETQQEHMSLKQTYKK